VLDRTGDARQEFNKSDAATVAVSADPVCAIYGQGLPRGGGGKGEPGSLLLGRDAGVACFAQLEGG
jgi:hypothetical protein